MSDGETPIGPDAYAALVEKVNRYPSMSNLSALANSSPAPVPVEGDVPVVPEAAVDAAQRYLTVRCGVRNRDCASGVAAAVLATRTDEPGDRERLLREVAAWLAENARWDRWMRDAIIDGRNGTTDARDAIFAALDAAVLPVVARQEDADE